MDKSAKPVQVSKPPPVEPRGARRRRLPQFTIFGLMVLMFVASVGFAQLYYTVRASQGETQYRMAAVLMSVAVPMLIMIVISLGYSLRKWLSGRRR